MKKLLIILMDCLLLSGCQKASPAEPSDAERSLTYSYSEAVASSSADEWETTQSEEFSILTKKYVTPLMGTGDAWKYSWEKASDIAADDLLLICAFNNELGLPRDAENMYKHDVNHVPADQIEIVIQKHFDVSGDYLKTSEYYSAKTNTYIMVGGFSGICQAVAMSAQQSENKIILEIGISCAISESELEGMGETAPSGLHSPNRIILPNRILVPAGRLTIDVKNENAVKYISYQLNESFSWD